MEVWDSIKKIVCSTAPILGNAIVPGVGGVAGALLAKALGTDADDPEAMLAQLETASPETWAKIRQVEIENETKLVEIGADLDKAYLADRDGARSRDVAIRQAGQQNKRADLMVLMDALGLLACIAAMITIAIVANDANNTALMAINGPVGTMAGFFGAGLRDAHSFEFGTSRGSRSKDALLATAKVDK